MRLHESRSWSIRKEGRTDGKKQGNGKERRKKGREKKMGNKEGRVKGKGKEGRKGKRKREIKKEMGRKEGREKGNGK